MSGDPDAPEPRGCSLGASPRPPRGCSSYSMGADPFAPVGYDAFMGFHRANNISARDMGFAINEPHYIPIAGSDSND